MVFWFEKGDSRRFPRVEMPVQLHITTNEPIRNAEIYALDIDYFPPSVEKKIQKTKLELWHWIKNIQEQKDILEPVFIESINLIDTFGEVLKGASHGKSPALDPKEAIVLQHLCTGFQKFYTLKEPAPRTFQYFQQINEKFLVYSKNLTFSVKKSSPSKFVSTLKFQTEFDIDKTISNFQNPKFQHIPLAQALFYLSQYLNLHLEAYTEFLNDLQPIKSAKNLTAKDISISTCGIAIKANKRFSRSKKVTVLFYFPETDEEIKLTAAVIRCSTLNSEQTESNALDFYFPTGREQNIIQRQVELFQLNRCLDIAI